MPGQNFILIFIFPIILIRLDFGVPLQLFKIWLKNLSRILWLATVRPPALLAE